MVRLEVVEEVSRQDLRLEVLGESKYKLLPTEFKTKKKTEELLYKQNSETNRQLFWRLFRYLEDNKKAFIGIGESRGKTLEITIGGLTISGVKEKAIDEAGYSTKRLCKTGDGGEVGNRYFCKTCQTEHNFNEWKTGVCLTKDDLTTLPLEVVKQVKELKQKVFILFSDGKTITASEGFFPEQFRAIEINEAVAVEKAQVEELGEFISLELEGRKGYTSLEDRSLDKLIEVLDLAKRGELKQDEDIQIQILPVQQEDLVKSLLKKKRLEVKNAV
jgi:hypothetical protein